MCSSDLSPGSAVRRSSAAPCQPRSRLDALRREELLKMASISPLRLRLVASIFRFFSDGTLILVPTLLCSSHRGRGRRRHGNRSESQRQNPARPALTSTPLLSLPPFVLRVAH